MQDSVLIVTGNFPPDSGGPAKFAENFGIWCGRKGLETTIITYGESPNRRNYASNVSVISVNQVTSLFIKLIRMMITIAKNADRSDNILAVGSFIEVYFTSLIRKFEYVAKVPGDIVWERARNNNITKLNINDFQKVKLNWKYKLFRRVFTKSLLKARKIIVPSLGLYELCLLWGIPAEKLSLIHNSVGNEFIQSEPLKIKNYDIVTVCRLTPWKGVGDLIKYSADFNRKLAVIGDGPIRLELENYAHSINAPVYFFGDLPQREVIQILCQSKVFVLNSTYEGLPHALIEARAVGILSVARAGTGSEEVIQDDIDGFLIRENRDLVQTLAKAFSVNSSKSNMQDKAKLDISKRFNLETNFSSIFKLLLGNY